MIIGNVGHSRLMPVTGHYVPLEKLVTKDGEKLPPNFLSSFSSGNRYLTCNKDNLKVTTMDKIRTERHGGEERAGSRGVGDKIAFKGQPARKIARRVTRQACFQGGIKIPVFR